MAGSSWSARNTVEGFARGEPNRVLVRFAAAELARVRSGRALDIGCGAARNASALSAMGWDVLGTDLSWPMLCAARERMRTVAGHFQGVLAPMDALPVAAGAIDLIIAHGIWNLAGSGKQFRRAVDCSLPPPRQSRKSWQRPFSTCGRSSTTSPGYGPRSATGIASPFLARPARNRERSSTTRSSARRRHSRRWAATSSPEAGLD